jgi:hypothetical protein
MTLLRRVLTAGAFLLIVISVPLIAIPGPVVDGVMGQTRPTDDVWIRLFGTAGLTLALFHVLILRKLDDLWWWCWAFVIFDGVSALVVLLHAVVGVPVGSASWPWWAYGGGSALFTGLYLAGLARAGREKPLA